MSYNKTAYERTLIERNDLLLIEDRTLMGYMWYVLMHKKDGGEMFSWVDYTIPEEELIPRREKISCPKCHYEPTYPEIEHMYNIVKMLKRKK